MKMKNVLEEFEDSILEINSKDIYGNKKDTKFLKAMNFVVTNMPKLAYAKKVYNNYKMKYFCKLNDEQHWNDGFYDLIQDSTISVLNSLNKKGCNAGEYLKYFKVAFKSLLKNYFRNIKNNRSVEEDDIVSNDDYLDEIINKEMLDMIMDHLVEIHSTKPKDVICFVLGKFENINLQDIADELKLPLSTVKSKIYRIRKELHNLLN